MQLGFQHSMLERRNRRGLPGLTKSSNTIFSKEQTKVTKDSDTIFISLTLVTCLFSFAPCARSS